MECFCFRGVLGVSFVLACYAMIRILQGPIVGGVMEELRFGGVFVGVSLVLFYCCML